MVNPCPNGFFVLLHYWWEGQWHSHPLSYRPRNLVDSFWNGSRVVSNIVGRASCWESDFVSEIEDVKFGVFSTLAEWHENCKETWECSDSNYFTIDPNTRSRCFSPAGPTIPLSPILRGTASLPPPPPRKMCGCDCNTIASIIAEHMAEKQRLLDAIKEHVDMRTLEQLKHTNEMLQSIDMDLDLQPVIDEMKRVEANLWNGISGGG